MHCKIIIGAYLSVGYLHREHGQKRVRQLMAHAGDANVEVYHWTTRLKFKQMKFILHLCVCIGT